MESPETRYAKTADGVHIADQVVGEGPTDLVYVPGSSSSLELDGEHELKGVPDRCRLYRVVG